MRLIDADKLLEKKTVPLGFRCEVVTVNDINNAPTIDSESLRPKGEWIACGDGENVPWMCSHCGKTTAHKYKVMYGNFCPNCGADMREE